jgi:4'-phosphopantetheinyl transferase
MACNAAPTGTLRSEGRWPQRETPPELRPGEVHLWAVPLDLSLADDLPPVLDREEQARARRLRGAQARARFARARAVLRVLLGAYAGAEPGSLSFRVAAQGKPSLPDVPELRFSLAHSGALALVGVAHGLDLGVDVERRRAVEDASSLARRYLAPEEALALAALPPESRSEAFLRCWTLKEAVLKATGEGLSRSLDSFRVAFAPGDSARLLDLPGLHGPAGSWSLHELAPASGYVGAVAVRSPECRLRRATLRL